MLKIALKDIINRDADIPSLEEKAKKYILTLYRI